MRGEEEDLPACADRTISLTKSDGGDDRNEAGGLRGGGGDNTTEDNDDDDEDHNNNTTIKQCTGERGADDDGGDWQLAFGGVDDDR